MHDLEAEAQQILSDFKRRTLGKRVEAPKPSVTLAVTDNTEASGDDSLEAFEADLRKQYQLPIKIDTKTQATMHWANLYPNPTDRGGRGVKAKPLPSYIGRKW
jgi:hypothetical protein